MRAAERGPPHPELGLSGCPSRALLAGAEAGGAGPPRRWGSGCSAMLGAPGPPGAPLGAGGGEERGGRGGGGARAGPTNPAPRRGSARRGCCSVPRGRHPIAATRSGHAARRGGCGPDSCRLRSMDAPTPSVPRGKLRQGAARSVGGAGRMPALPPLCLVSSSPSRGCEGETPAGRHPGPGGQSRSDPTRAAGRARPPRGGVWRNPRRSLGWRVPTSKLLWPEAAAPTCRGRTHPVSEEVGLDQLIPGQGLGSAPGILASVPGHRHHEGPVSKGNGLGGGSGCGRLSTEGPAVPAAQELAEAERWERGLARRLAEAGQTDIAEGGLWPQAGDGKGVLASQPPGRAPWADGRQPAPAQLAT